MEEQYFLIYTVKLLYFEILVDLDVFRSQRISVVCGLGDQLILQSEECHLKTIRQSVGG